MTPKQGYLFAAVLFVTTLAILAYPYFEARYLSSDLLPSPEIESAGVEEPESVIDELLPNTLTIRNLAIEAPVVYITEKSERAYQDALRDGVVHYPGTAMPGELGNVYIFGHSSDYVWSPGAYKTIFARLPQIEIGEQIEITDADGKSFVYVVTETKVVGPRDLSVLDQFNYEKRVLTLQTSYPLGTALQRYIVVAELKID